MTSVSGSAVLGSGLEVKDSVDLHVSGTCFWVGSRGGLGKTFSTNLQFTNLAFWMLPLVRSMYRMMLGESKPKYKASNLCGPMVFRLGSAVGIHT